MNYIEMEGKNREMLLGIAGVTGVGKSYYKDLLVKELEFEKIKILTTREPRKGEKNNDDKIFITKEELDKLEDDGEIAYKFELLDVWYAYTKEAVFSNKNTVFELHYDKIFDFKDICPNLKTLYLLPNNIEIPIEKLKQRELKPEVERKRILEVEEHYNRFNTDEKLRSMFDYILYNNYDKDSEEKVLKAVKEMLK